MPVPCVADGDRDPELAAPRLRPGRLVHARADDTQLELGDAALHAEQEPVVRTARIVHAVEVDDAGLDQAAQLEQMMPVAAIAGETRGIETQHGTDLPGAQGGDETIETGPPDGATRRPAEIVVDDLNIGEASPARHLDQLVLPPLALQVRLHLLWRRLAHIDDGLALQQCCGKKRVTRGHRRPPALLCRRPRVAEEPASSEPCSARPVSCPAASGRRERGRAGAVLSREGLAGSE